jgi:serine/threonine protein kinase
LGIVNCVLSHHSNILLHDSAYADLQQMRGAATQACDLYALGAVLYFVLTGHDPQPLAVNHVRSIKPTLSRSIDELVARLMAPHPVDCGAMLYELGAVAGQNAAQFIAASNDKDGEA